MFWTRALATLAVAMGLTAPAAASDERDHRPFSAEDLVTGMALSRQQCDALSGSIWVESLGGMPVCLRSYFSDAGGSGKVALVYFYGDMLDKQAPGGHPAPYPGYERFSPAFLNAQAETWSVRSRGPVVILARPGTFGSSGSEGRDRHTNLEADIVNAALDQIKSRRHFESFDLLGHSAGGSLVFAMVELRADIRCATSAAGALSAVEAQRLVGFQPDARYIARTFDPITHIDRIASRPGQRLIVVNDPDDKAVVATSIVHFLHELDKRSIQYLHIETDASDSDHHQVSSAGLRAAMACAHGNSDADIAAMAGRAAQVH
jgi:pimeloyl-ACP methyl ester carboxylesterase